MFIIPVDLKGYIKKINNLARAIEINEATEESQNFIEIPLLGMIAAGEPIEATLKRIYKEKNGFNLQPANDNYKPIHTKDLEIRGLVTGIFHYNLGR